MNTKNIFKALALAMLMPAMLLTTACSNDDDAVNNENTAKNGYTLPVTINVSRQDDGTTRATFDGSKLNFGEGDKLFVEGPNNGGAGQFAGTLTWQSGGTFSGTIYTQNPYSGTADELFSAATSTATLLPNGYQSTGFLSIDNNNTTDIAYDDEASAYFNGAFVASETAKATGVEQLSFEQASTYSSGFALTPRCAILNFTISGLEAGEKTVTLNVVKGKDYTVTGSVTPNASGVATFAVGVPVGANIKEGSNNLTVGTHNFTLPSSTTFAAGKIYNITRAVNAINGKFTINGDGDKVYFSKGNLQYDGTNWKFADNQWDVLGADGTKANGTATKLPMDLFTWGNTSSSTEWGGNSNYTANADLSGSTDWGSNMGTGWRTLTGGSGGEWEYLFGTNSSNKRTTTSGILYAKATVNGVAGVILLPDDWSASYHSLTSYNTTNVAYNTNIITDTGWSNDFEAHGAVFLPAAGLRNGTSVSNVGSLGFYWSSTAGGSAAAYNVSFNSGDVNPASYGDRSNGFSVRLVRPVQGAPAPAPEEDFVTFTNGTNTVKVAKMNLGATSVAESAATCYGDYYAWGATEPFGTVSSYNAGTVTPTTGHDGGYSQNNAPFWNKDASVYTKYTSASDATLEAEDDAVAANMPGYHMPTRAEFQTLYAACGGTGTSKIPSSISSGAAYAKGIYWVAGGDAEVTIGSDTYKVNGLLFVQDADTHVFFPATGYIYDTNLKNAGSHGYYWSSSFDTSYAYADLAYILFFYSASVNPEGSSYRKYGYSVRPFKD